LFTSAGFLICNDDLLQGPHLFFIAPLDKP
jgi:hypothetical protein